jgi:titin
LVNTIVSGNTSGQGGGGIYVAGGSAVITDSRIVDNDSNAYGAGILAYAATITRSTVAMNDALSGGRGAVVATPLKIVSSTISGNTPSGIVSNSSAGALAASLVIAGSTLVGNGSANVEAGAATFYGSVLAGALSGQCASLNTISSLGSNYEATTNTCGLNSPADTKSGADPLLGPLEDNGGPGPTHLPMPGSPLIDKIPSASCDDGDAAAGSTLTVDERSRPRPTTAGASCEIGAVELQPPWPPIVTAATPGNTTAQLTFVTKSDREVIDATATCVPVGGGATRSNTGTSPLTVTSLVNGTTYSCTVAARSAIGTGGPSNAVSVKPVGSPGPPLSPTASPSGSGGARVIVNPPASNGGAAITSYRATCTAPNKPTRSATGSRSLLVTTMFNGTTYSCRVVAINAAGAGPPSAAVSVRVGAPGAPSVVTVSKGSTAGSIRVGWGSAASNAAPITGYTVVCVPSSGPSKTVLDSASPAQVTGLSRTKTYKCRVHARNKYGTGPPRTASSAIFPK